ncbi:MAG TPA: hypothetical protein VFY23_08065, partial [Candidatus Limnocylindrales bacterium]|nr:hypothetical protein [Candidatus Limnocylindrales bacterium]
HPQPPALQRLALRGSRRTFGGFGSFRHGASLPAMEPDVPLARGPHPAAQHARACPAVRP